MTAFRSVVIVRTVIVSLAVIGLAILSTDSVIGWLVPLAVIGGGLMAAGLMLTRSRERHASYSSDSFAREGVSAGIINMSRIRVAGLGGLGLLLVSVLVAFQFQLTAAALTIGVIGGALGGVAAILYRRWHA